VRIDKKAQPGFENIVFEKQHGLNSKEMKATLILLMSYLLMSLFGISESAVAQSTLLHSLPAVHTNIQDEPHLSRSFQVQGVPDLRVNLPDGDIDVQFVPDIREVEVELYTKRSFSLWSGTRSLDTYRIIVQQRGDQIIASVEDRRSGRSARGSNIEFSFVIRVPEEVSANLRTINGKIALEGVKGEQFLQNQTGNLSVKNTQGDVRAVSTTGNITLQNIAGNAFAKSVNGRIQVRNSEGEVRLRSVAGDIVAEGLSGTLVSGSTSGSITADFDDVAVGVYMETISGNINLTLPKTAGYELTGKAMRFDLEGIESSSITSRTLRNRDAKLTIRDGEIPVNLSTISGRITVRESN